MGLNYKISGNDMQYAQILLEPQQEAIVEQGAMMYIGQHVNMRAILGDGSSSRLGVIGRFWKALKRSFTGESMFSSLYENKSSTSQVITIAAPGPGQIVPINLDEQDGTVICQKGAYLAGERGQKIQLAFQKRVRVGLLGGEGFIMQKITGSGIVFIHACGALKTLTLGPSDVLKVDTGCLVGMSSTVRYDIKYTGSLKTSLFGGEGLFYATVSGPGTVWIQSMPMNRLSKLLLGAALTGKGSKAGRWYLFGVVIFVLYTLIMAGAPPQ